MKKFILSLIFGISVLFSLSSCVTSAYAQDVVISNDGDNVDVSFVIRYGTPYYINGSLQYYLYNGWYYYPYYYNNHYYYYRYSRPLPPPRHGHRFTPGRYDRPYFRHHVNHRPMRSSTYSTHRFGNHTARPTHTQMGAFGRPTPHMRGNAAPHGNGRFGGRR